MTTEYEILTAIKFRLDAVTEFKLVGFYPDEYQTAASLNRLPAVLIFNGNSATQFRSGRRNYNRVNISVLLYTDFTYNRTSQVLALQKLVTDAVVTNIQYDGLVSNIFGYTVDVGDQTDFITPSSTGMNGHMTVRKITFDFQYYTCGTS